MPKFSFQKYIKFEFLLLLVPLIMVNKYISFDYLFLKTTIAGGDTPSHYPTFLYLKKILIQNFAIAGWEMGNLCGFPILQHYFPLPFLIIVILSLIFPPEVAFKIGFVLPIFGIPYCIYFFVKAIYKNNIAAALCSFATLAFLFNDGNVMWGGNIYSFLAGEFCYGYSMCFMLLYLGSLYDTVQKGSSFKRSCIFLACTGLSHAYPFIFVTIASTFWLFALGNLKDSFKKLFLINLIAFLIMGIWALPLLSNLKLVTPLQHQWFFEDIYDFLKQFSPYMLLPFFLLSLFMFGLLLFIKRLRVLETFYLLYSILCGLLLYFYAYRLWQSDVRFLPFSQILLCIGGLAILANLVLSKIHGRAFVVLFVLAVPYWINSNIGDAKNWINYSLSGLETKPNWSHFQRIVETIKGDRNSARVIYEHSILNELTGTVRIFELLPFYSGRSTLEGLYMQTSPVSPSIFYLQSLFTKTPSAPFPEYSYGRFDLDRGHIRLSTMHVNTVIAVTDELKLRLQYSNKFRFLDRMGPYEIYKTTETENGYAFAPKFMPVVYTGKDWRYLFYDWFRFGDLEVPVIYCDKNCNQLAQFPKIKDIKEIKKIPVYGSQPQNINMVANDRIVVEGAEVGKPLILKVSYHKNWKVNGADRIYMCSPGFMMVIPKTSVLEFYYTNGVEFYFGSVLTIVGIVLLFLYKPSSQAAYTSNTKKQLYAISIASLLTLLGSFFPNRAPEIAIRDVIRLVDREDYEKALSFIEPYSKMRYNIALPSLLYYKGICLEKLEQMELAIQTYKEIIERFFDTDMASYAMYRLGGIYERQGMTSLAREIFDKCFYEYQFEGCYNELIRLQGNGKKEVFD